MSGTNEENDFHKILTSTPPPSTSSGIGGKHTFHHNLGSFTITYIITLSLLAKCQPPPLLSEQFTNVICERPLNNEYMYICFIYTIQY